MPLPLLAILGMGAAALVGAGAHIDAKETNEKAQATLEDAQRIYNNAKSSLEAEQGKTEKALLALGYTKKNVLETSIAQFLRAYEHIKDIELTDSPGINEIANMPIEKQEVIELQEMSNIYSSTFASGATGAAAGAVVALAASGSLPIVTGVLSTAGTALAAGEIGIAAGLAGSALSFGAAMTPLAAIAAPAVLFSGISSSIKADENLEKARKSYAEAELAVEKMETAGTLCRAISKKSQMYDGLLNELNVMFSKCTSLLEGVTNKKRGIFNNKKITINNLTVEEKNLIAVTGSLATAVKAVLDTPILDKNGNVSPNAQTVYDNTTKLLPSFAEKVEKIENTKFAAKPRMIKSNTGKVSNVKTTDVKSNTFAKTIRNIFAIIAGLFAMPMSQAITSGSTLVTSLVFSSVTLAIMDNNTTSKFFAFIKKVLCLSLFVEFTLIFYQICSNLADLDHYILKTIIFGVVSFIIFAVTLPQQSNRVNSIKCTLCRIAACVCTACLGILIYGFVAGFLGLDFAFIKILLTLVYALFAWLFTVSLEEYF